MKLSRLTWAALAALGLTLATPASPAAAAPTGCPSDGVVRSIANNLPIFDERSITGGRLYTAQRGDYLHCSGNYSLGGRYNACGVTLANGWVFVEVPGHSYWGWTYMTCLVD